MESFPDWLNATLASDAAQGKGVLGSGVRALRPGLRVVGPAQVALVAGDNNKAVRDVLAQPPVPGHVLVVAGAEESRNAVVGGLLALELELLGFRGLVTDGPIRDYQEIAALSLGVWCRGVTPIAGVAQGAGRVGTDVVIAGALVRQGDLVVADDDGVVIWPQEEVANLLERAKARYDSDLARLGALQARRR